MPPNLNPNTLISEIILPPTGSAAFVMPSLAYGIYSSSAFISGAVDMVAYVYQRLGGNVLDLEIEPSNVYNAYESAILKYSEIMNNHHGKNILFSLLGFNTGTFDSDGNLTSGQSVSLMYAPPFSFGLSRQIGYAYGNEAGVGGNLPLYSASFDIEENVQDYDLQYILQNDPIYSGIIGNNKIVIREVFYKNPRLQWRYFGGYFGNYGYGGGGGVGGGYSGNTNMYLIPTWEDKLRAAQFEDALSVRISHYTYELKNNKIRIFPIPRHYFQQKMWIKFWIPNGSIDSLLSGSMTNGVTGINGPATLPLTNIPFESINSPGKSFIRDYALALCKQTLGRVRSKYDRVPFLNTDVTLDGKDLLAEAKDELKDLVDKLTVYLDKLTNSELAKQNESLLELDMKLKSRIPSRIWKI